MQTIYTLSACEKLMEKNMVNHGENYHIKGGSLGLGLIICQAPGKKTAIIQETYLNAWSSGHTIRLYNKTPQKYQKLIEKIAF